VATGGGLRVEGDAALVGVEVEEEAALLGIGHIMQKRAVPPRSVAGQRPLNLDRLGAQVREELPALGSGDQVAVLEDLDVFQRLFRHLPLAVFSDVNIKSDKPFVI
jgi:hypothetical protein